MKCIRVLMLAAVIFAAPCAYDVVSPEPSLLAGFLAVAAGS
ncbi:hypothetical protein [Shinella sp.]|nr:hypothetical protein [Shinella sp.]MDX3973756.1 hypothetical protein [Shinella sp.]